MTACVAIEPLQCGSMPLPDLVTCHQEKCGASRPLLGVGETGSPDESFPTSPAQHHALRLPEICRAMFEHLDNASLAAAARVCRTWFAPAVAVLWRTLPPPSRLALATVTGVRCLLYGPAIRQLSVSETTPLDAWTFPGVRALLFRFRRGSPTRGLHSVLDRCGDALERVDFECAAELRDSSPHSDWQRCLTAGDLQLLARRCRRLRRLHAAYYISRDVVRAAVADVCTRFGRLRELALCLGSDSVPAIVVLVDGGANLAVLVLRMMTVMPEHDWGVLARLRALRELCVEWTMPHSMTAAEFASLAELPAGVRTLRLLNQNSGSPEVCADHWLAVASRLTNLTHLRADVCGQFDGAVLRIVGEQCRQLESLQLHMPCEPPMLALSVEPILFPRLRELELDTFTGFERLK